MKFKFEVSGAEKLNVELLALQDRIEDIAPAFEIIATMFAEDEAQLFESEGASGGEPWSPLSPGYAAWKERNYLGQKILQLRGDLRRSLTQRPFPVEAINSRGMTVGTDISYAKYHQYGTARMPARPPAHVNVGARRSMMKVIQRYIVTGVV